MGVHTNMCVVGRPFGLRNLVRFGKNVVLMRDLTDTMYNSRRPPRVPHFTGTDLIVSHIERTICPTVTSSDLLGGSPFRFAADRRPRVVFLSAENEYGAAEALPEFARHLELEAGLSTEVLQGSTDAGAADRDCIPGMAALEGADLAVLFVRRRALPATDMGRLREYLQRGRPLIALRTSSHAFSVRGEIPEGLVDWKSFDREVLGATYDGHFGGASVVGIAPEERNHPILSGLVQGALAGPWPVEESLYKNHSLAETCRVLLEGMNAPKGGAAERAKRAPPDDPSRQPVAWTNAYGRSRVFYASLGSSWASFKQEWFQRLLVNAIFWALDREPVLPELLTR